MSWVQASLQMRLSDLVDATHQGSHAHRGLFGCGKLEGSVKRRVLYLLKSLLNIFRLPEEPLNILNPFEVRHDYTT
jgi:hypothetical protein